MAEYISRDELRKHLADCMTAEFFDSDMKKAVFGIDVYVENMPAADVQPVNQCKMIPQNPDCRGYTDTFFCTNCQLHIHLGFIGQRYGGNYCIECGAEVEDGDTNVKNTTMYSKNCK